MNIMPSRMSEDDYALVAQAINNTKIMFPAEIKSMVWLTSYLIQLFSFDNPNFNKPKFIKYCGLEGYVK